MYFFILIFRRFEKKNNLNFGPKIFKMDLGVVKPIPKT